MVLLAGGPAERSFVLPAAEELAPNTVARVSDVPVRKATITTAEFRRQLLRIASAGGRSVPKAGSPRYERLEGDAVDLLLEIPWIQGEAAEMGISVTRREVSNTVALVKRQNFASEAEYQRFLRKTHYTRRDVYERVELQLLASRLRGRIVRRIEREARNPYEEQRAFREFVAEFNEKWRARTVCAPRYATERCSNGPPP